MSTRFLRLPEVLRRVPFSKPTIYRRISKGLFPAAYDLSGDGRIVGWLESEVEAWIAERVEAGKRAPLAIAPAARAHV